MMENEPRPVVWMGSSKKDLRGFPAEVQKKLGYSLWRAQQGEHPAAAKVLKGFKGGGVLELIADHDGSTYRLVYTVRFPEFVYVLHGFQKKSKKGVKTPVRDIAVIRRRLKAAEEDHAKWKAKKEKEDQGRTK
jgi:phage-related protein